VRRIALALALLASARASAIEFHIKSEGLRLDITESLYSAYHGDLGYLIVETDAKGLPHPENHFYDLLNKLNVALQWRNWRLYTRFDSAGFFDTPPLSCVPSSMALLRSRFCQQPFYYEKAALEYTSRTVEATLGDFYVSFGRGLALSLRKLDELGIDTTLLGGKLVFHEGNAGATLVVGATNIQNIDEATGRYAPDPFDAIAGARIEYRVLDKITIGAHATGGVMRKNAGVGAQLRPDGMYMYGATIDAPRLARWLSLYAEADGQMQVIGDKRQNAYAIYGALTGYFGPVSLLLEVKHYANFQRWKSSVDPTLPEFAPIAYNQPPTAERIVTELVAPDYDVTGPRLRADWRVNRWLLLYASYAYFEDRGAGDLLYHDPYAGAEFRWNQGRSHFFPSAGYRVELCGPKSDPSCTQPIVKSATSGSGEYQTIAHVEWDATQALPHRLSLETQGQALFRRGERELNLDGSVGTWSEGDAYLALKWTPHLVFVAGFEWTTRPSSTSATQFYENGSVQWNITTASSIRLFVGGMRGGLRCISGVCRDFPAFTGAKLEVVVRL
jgi:hypothetical protein